MKNLNLLFQNLFSPALQEFIKSWYLPCIFATLSTLVITNNINRYKNNLSASTHTEEVLIVNKSLYKGDTLTSDDLDIAQLALKHLPAGVLRPSEINQIIGTPLNKSLAKNELLLWSFLEISPLNKLPSDQIEPGHRLIALSINSVDSMGFRIQKGDYIDLIHTATLADNHSPSTYTLLQNIMVLGIGENSQNNTEQTYNTISLMVLPKEALMIKNAQENGDLSFLLRNPVDQKTNTHLPIINKKDISEQAFRNTLQNERNKAIDLIKGNKRVTSNDKF
ncbi:MAG TPA: Flp pilus assembly protein CpaB [Oligoflexia bacterium]|nr:Flp pilus assembly protein CpaB [Oligoflexia bacterium]HMR23776.1 Flp pilus assembly protein CpaB [Oligoflexia bacterium]